MSNYYDEQKKTNIALNDMIERAIQKKINELDITEIILNITEKFSISEKYIHKRLTMLETRQLFKIKNNKIIFNHQHQ